MGDILLTTVVPAFGALMSLLMYASPLSAVLHASKVKTLGDLNPIPFVVTVANCVVWNTYGLIKQDPFVVSPNGPGMVIALFSALTCFGLADDKLRERIRLLLCVELSLLAFLGLLTSFAAATQTDQLTIWGLAGNVMALIYYASPLSTMAEVIRTRNSASILFPMTIMNCLNASLWTTYGLAMADVYIWVPNAIGLVLSVMQLALGFIFPSRPKVSSGGAAPNSAALHEAPYVRLTHATGDHEDGHHHHTLSKA